MPLYTFVMDFEGGTYVSQVRARSERSAPRRWAEALDVGAVAGMGPASKRELVRKMREYPPVPLSGLRKAWCVGGLVRGRLALVHFFETAE